MSVTTAISERPNDEQSLLTSTRTAVEGKELSIFETLKLMGREAIQREIYPTEKDTTTTTSSKRSRRSVKEEENQSVIGQLLDFSPTTLPCTGATFLLFAGSFRVICFSVFSVIGRYLLAPFITRLIPPIALTVTGSVVLPLLSFYCKIDSEMNNSNNEIIRAVPLTVFLVSFFGQGLFVGAGLAHLSIPSEPFIALTIVGCYFSLSAYHRSKGYLLFHDAKLPRLPSLALVAATSLCVHIPAALLYKLFFGGPTLTYYVLTGAYTLSVMIPLQYKCAYRNMVIAPAASILAKCLVYGIYGVSHVAEVKDLN
ncbi:unnamed protein product [Caenorhabditis brenneri]